MGEWNQDDISKKLLVDPEPHLGERCLGSALNPGYRVAMHPKTRVPGARTPPLGLSSPLKSPPAQQAFSWAGAVVISAPVPPPTMASRAHLRCMGVAPSSWTHPMGGYSDVQGATQGGGGCPHPQQKLLQAIGHRCSCHSAESWGVRGWRPSGDPDAQGPRGGGSP